MQEYGSRCSVFSGSADQRYIQKLSKLLKVYNTNEAKATHQKIHNLTHHLAEETTTARRGLSKRIPDTADCRDRLTGSERSDKTRRDLSSAAETGTHQRQFKSCTYHEVNFHQETEQHYTTVTGKTCPVGRWHILFLKTSLGAASMIAS